ANNELSETNKLLYNDFKKSQAELERRNDVEYASKVEIDSKEAQIKLYKTREDKELDKVISLENKVKVLNNIVYKTGQSVQTMNMLNRNCKMSFTKPEFYKKAQRANPRLYDIGCYNDNLTLMLALESDEVIRLEKESRSKLSDLIRPFDYEKLNNLYDLFISQRKKSSEQRYFSERSRLSHTPVNNGNSKESFNKQTTLLEKWMDESIPWDQKCKSSKELFKIKTSVGTIFNGVKRCKETIAKRTYFGHIDPFIQNTIEANFCPEIQKINADLEKFHLCLNEEMVADLRYFNSLELEVNSLKSQLETQKTQFFNEIDQLSREYYYADHMNAILGVYAELNAVTNLQCDYLELLEKCECLKKELLKINIMSKSFESVQKHAINLELELQQCKEKMKKDKSFKDKGIAISELKKLIEKLKGKSVDTKFGKSSVIRQPNAFKSQRPSILGKPTIFSDSLERKDFSKLKSVSKNNVSNDFSKPVTAQILPLNKKSILKNTNVLAPGMYKLHTKPTQTKISQLPNDSRKTNKRVSFSTGVIPTTSVNRPQLKSNPMEDRVMLNNSQGKKKEVEDHRRNVKFSKNKMSVTACNDNLNSKTLNVTFVCATCGKRVLNEKHDMCVLKSHNGVNSRTKMPIDVPVSTREPKRTVTQSVAKPLKKIVASEPTNQKPKNILRKLYERVSKACSWWYSKFTPPGYNWKPKFEIGNVKPSTVSNTPLSSNSFAARTVKFGNDQIAHILGYGDLGNDLLTGSCGTDLYSITLQDTNSPNPICLMAKATSSQAWLWHHRLSHLNFDTINLISKNDIVIGLPKLKFVKDHLCSFCLSKEDFMLKDGENLDKMKEIGDACIFVRYSTQSRAYRVFNKRTRVIVETIHVNFDELPQMASDHVSTDPAPESETVTTSNELDLLFSLMFDELLNGSSQVVSKSSDVTTVNAHNQSQQQHTTSLNTQTTTEPTCQKPTHAPTVTSTENMNQAEMIAANAQVADDEFINIFSTPTKDHPLEQVIGNPSQSIRTRRQLESDGEMCMFALTMSRTEPKNIKEAMADSAWIESIQEELHQFERLDVWEIVDRPLCTNVINMKWRWKNKRDEENTVIRNKSRLVAKGYAYHFIKEKVEKGIVELFFVGTEYQLADLFTKALPEERFKYLVRRLDMRCLTPEELEVLANESA
nr:hypothetical protein [Tanacetum cinerariifolium]